MRHTDGLAAPAGGDAGVRHVLMTADAVGGVWTYALDLIDAFAPAGIEVTLAVMGPAMSPAQRDAVTRVPNVSLIERPFKLEWEADPWDDVASAREWLLGIAAERSVDVIHLNGFALANAAWPSPTVVVGHSCVLSWWQAVHGEAAPAEWSRYRLEVARGLAAADAVVAPTHAMRQALERHYGPLPRSRVILNGRTHPAVPRVRREPLVLCAGRLWDAAKNVDTLIAAAPQISWPVYLAGSLTPPSGATSTVVRENTGITCLGPLSAADLNRWMARASIYVLPARYEPFGLSALEAAQAGCALVLSAIDSLIEVWGDSAVYVPPNDGAMLASTIEALIADEPRRRELSRRAQARASALTMERMAGAYLETYGALPSRRLPPAGVVAGAAERALA
jgi:glycogen synthase